MADQGFTKPNRNAASWDSDLNANFTLLERGFVAPVVIGSMSVVTGTLVECRSITAANSLPLTTLYNPRQGIVEPYGVCMQAGSPGNTVYVLRRGMLNDWNPYSGFVTPGAHFYPSISTPGWVTSDITSQGSNCRLGRTFDQHNFSYDPLFLSSIPLTATVSGIAHAASAALGVFSFSIHAGAYGLNTRLRLRSNSCDNVRITFYSNSARTTIIYDTAVLSGNLGIRTIDYIDASVWAYSNDLDAYPGWGQLHGRVEVLSSAATAINSQAFQVNFAMLRMN